MWRTGLLNTCRHLEKNICAHQSNWSISVSWKESVTAQEQGGKSRKSVPQIQSAEYRLPKHCISFSIVCCSYHFFQEELRLPTVPFWTYYLSIFWMNRSKLRQILNKRKIEFYLDRSLCTVKNVSCAFSSHDRNITLCTPRFLQNLFWKAKII